MTTKTPPTIRTYSELIRIPDFLGRYEYLKLGGEVGSSTFGFERYLNQKFYHSNEWRSIRDYIIARDLGCDLSDECRRIYGKIYIHHMNPISTNDIRYSTEFLTDPEFLVCTSHTTHNAIHYGNASMLPQDLIERKPYDTCPWKAAKT